MKRPLLWVGIVFAILAQSSRGFQSASGDGGDVQLYLVVLDPPSVVEKIVEWTPDQGPPARRRLLDGSASAQYRKQIEQAQQAFAKSLSGPALFRAGQPVRPIEVVERRSFLIDSLLVRATPDQALFLARREGVKGVYPNARRFLLMDAAPELVGAPVFWQQLGGLSVAGRGVKIGIVDSGINTDHPMFKDPDSALTPPAGYPLGFSDFTNNKVIVARTYVKTQYGLQAQNNNTPEDEVGHGSQVAGVAAGKPVDAPLGFVRGIAPQAFLGNYKVFGDPNINSTTTSAAVIAAIEDAVADGMDVINLSLGGQARNPTSDPEQIAIANATALGVVVVVAAGNEGPDAGTVASPGTSPDAITVGATSHQRVFASSLRLTSQSTLPGDLEMLNYVPGNGAPISTAVGPLPLASIASFDPSEEACSALPDGSLNGKVALVRRGSCFFRDKAANVLDTGGALGMVVYNNVEGPAVTMSFCPSSPQPCLPGALPTEPAVMIEKSPGERLSAFLRSGGTSQLTFRPQTELAPFPSQADRLAAFSSRGPNIDLAVKPDLTAPGQSIYTASNQGQAFFNGANGTSFSTPMVSGGAALLRQLHPDWPADRIKSVLVNTAVKTPTLEGSPARVNEAGNGRLDLSRAVAAEATVRPVSLSFGLLGEESDQDLAQAFILTNISDRSRFFSFDLEPRFSNTALAFSVSPASLELGPGESATIHLNGVRVGSPVSGVFEGFVRIRDEEGGSDLTVSYWGSVAVEAKNQVLRVSQTAPSDFAAIDAALAAAQPGDVIEISDSATYPTTVRIGFNKEGLLLSGLTLRAAAGESPIIDGTGLADGEAVVRVTGTVEAPLKGITIEGLTIRGGETGIEFRNAGGVIRGNRIEGGPRSSSGFGVLLNGSRAHVYGNTILGINGSGVAVFDDPLQPIRPGALIQRNQVGDGTGNSENGIFAQGSVALFENTISGSGSGDKGQGIRLSDASALVKGNTVETTQGDLGDGILVRGQGRDFLIRDNLVKGNQRFGISVFDGARASVLGNIVRRNQDSGLLVRDSSAFVRWNHLIENGSGVSLFSSDLELSDSALAASDGDGLEAEDSIVSIANATFFGNQGFGINLFETTAFVSDSIFQQNGSGDVSESGKDALVSNLVQDDQLQGSNGNFSGQPRFTEPDAFDFSLQAGSDAIDRGSGNTSFSDTDLLFHQRAVDGDNDGRVAVDVGAVEFASQAASPLILPILSTDPADFVGLAMANAFAPPDDPSGPFPAPLSTRVSLQAYSPEGKAFGDRFETEIKGGQQSSILLSQAIGVLQAGWVEVLPSHPELMSFALTGSNSLTFLDGTQLDSRIARALLFPEIRNQEKENTWIHIVNPGEDAVDVTLTWVRSIGAVSKIQQLAAKGMISATFRELFGEGSGGYLKVEAPAPLYGLEIFGNSASKAGLLALDYELASPDLFAAHFASSGVIETHLNIVNTGETSTPTLTARDEDGKVLGSVPVQLAAGQQLEVEVGSFFGLGVDQAGWIEVHSDSGKMLGDVRFGDPEGRFLSSLPLQARGAREFVLSHLAETSQVFTGVTLLNACAEEALLTVEVFEPGGEETGLVFLQLRPWQKTARLLSELVENLKDQSGGFIRVRSNQKILGFELFGSRSLEFLSAVPQQVVVE
ncbi:MAG: S8 family serine peptidase [Acidobacteriota bacterium]